MMPCKTKLNFVGLIATAITSLLSGCASIQMGDPVKSTELKKFQPMDAMAQIYVCRNGNIMGGGIRPHIEIDKKPLATIALSTFAHAELQPGNYVMVAKTPEHDSVMPFTVAAGQQKFFQTWIVPGVFAGRGIIDEISAEDGKECVRNGELVEAVMK